MKIINLISKNKYFFSGLLILLIVLVVNRFPEGYALSSSDNSQMINTGENFYNYFFDYSAWTIYLFFLYVLDFFGAGNHLQLLAHIGFFTLASYVSFYVFTKLFFKAGDLVRSGLSLFYSLNLFTLYIFTSHSLGYSPFFWLYISFPLLFGLFFKFLETGRANHLIFFGLVSFIFSSGFGNQAFMFSLVIVLFLTAVMMVVLKKINIEWRSVLRFIIIFLILFLTNAYWILYSSPSIESGVTSLSTTNPTNLFLALKKSASPIINTFSLIHYSYDYFPFNFPYAKIQFLKDFFIALSFIPIFLSVFFIAIKRNSLFKKNNLIVFGLLLSLTMLIARITNPFENINQIIFIKIWGFSTLRGLDKTAIFFPFFLALASLFTLDYWEKNGKKKLVMIILFLILITPLPFYFGKIQQNMSVRYAGLSPQKKDYQTARLTFLVKIPDEYYLIKPIIDLQKEKFFVSTLPYNFGDTGTGASNFPKWKLNGVDITQKLLNKKFIEANAKYYPEWYFAREFNESNLKNNNWIIKLLGMMNAKYIIYHKDAPDDAVGKTLFKMRDLEKNGLIQNIEENDYFILYSIHNDYFLPYISWQSEDIEVQGNAHSIGSSFEKIKSATRDAEFQEINPKKFVINLKNKEIGENLILSETFNPLWKAYAIEQGGKETEIKNHFLARGYANGWKIENPENISQIVIEYYPIRLMWRGMAISLATVLFLIIYLIKYYYVKRKMVKT